MIMQKTRLAGACWLLVLLAAAPSIALADAPGLRGPESAPVGDVGSTAWTDIEPLPPLSGELEPSGHPVDGERWGTARVPAAAIYDQVPDKTIGTAAFSLRALNPGNWVLDAGLGIVSAAMQSVQQTLLGFVSAVGGTTPPTAEADTNLGCAGSMSLLFCTTPKQLLPSYDRLDPKMTTVPGIVPQALNTIWLALQPAAFALLTIVFTVRLGRVMYAGPAAFRSEVKALLLPFLAASALVAITPMLLRILLSIFAALNAAIISGGIVDRAVLEIPFLTYVPTDFLPSLALGPTLAVLALYVVLFCAFVAAIVRLAKLALLFALAPLAGATLIDRGTAHYFHAWLSRVLELLLHQLGWSVGALVGSTVLRTLLPAQEDTTTDGNAFVIQTIGTTLILLFMLYHQQLFSGVFALAAGAPSPVMGSNVLTRAANAVSMRDPLGKAANAFTASDGVLRTRTYWRDRRAAASPRPNSAAPGVNRTPPAPQTPGSSGAGGGNGGRSSSPGTASAAKPGSRARAAAPHRSSNTRPRPATPQTSQATPNGGPVGYIAAGRARRTGAAVLRATAPAVIVPAPPDRVALIGHLQAQAPQNGRQAWRSAPAAFAHEARWHAHAVSSVAGRRALRGLVRRPDAMRRNVAGSARRPVPKAS